MSIWSWITGEVEVIGELKPVVTEGEAIIADLKQIIKDIKAGDLTDSAADAKKIADDVAAFAAAVEQIVAGLQVQPAHQMAFTGRVEKHSKIHNQHRNRLKSPFGGTNNDKHK
jgi:hypothetical protein